MTSADRALDRIGIRVTASAAGSAIRLGVREDDGGKPGALLLDAGTVDSSTTGAKEITIAQAIPARCWLTVTAQGGAPTVIANLGGTFAGTLIGRSSGTDTGDYAAIVQTGVTGALPSTWTPSSRVPTAPMPFVRAT